MNFQKFSATIFPLLLALLLFGCAASQKMQAANILRQCKVEIIGASLDSINLDLEKIIGKDEKPLHRLIQPVDDTKIRLSRLLRFRIQIIFQLTDTI